MGERKEDEDEFERRRTVSCHRRRMRSIRRKQSRRGRKEGCRDNLEDIKTFSIILKDKIMFKHLTC